MKPSLFKILTSNAEEQDSILKHLSAFNRSQLNIQSEKPSSLPLNFHIKNNGVIIGGINANLYFLQSILHIDHLFVDETYRGLDLGSKLLNHVEEIAKSKGARLSHLDTFDFQAKDFYLKQEYEVFGILDDCPKDHQRFYMKKSL